VSSGRLLALAVAGLCVAAGCRMDMQDQPRYEPDAASAFFSDGRADRPQVEGAVARGRFHEDPAFFRGQDPEGDPVATLPVPVDAALLQRGQQRYDIYCSPCHGRIGDGSGMIVERGYRRPASFHEQRLRDAPAGYFFDAISRGFGMMPSYAAQVPVSDRWAIVAYVRALQLSQNFPAGELSPAERARVDAGASAAASGEAAADASAHGRSH
jgi:mono/diheme cytochrome c family protein